MRSEELGMKKIFYAVLIFLVFIFGQNSYAETQDELNRMSSFISAFTETYFFNFNIADEDLGDLIFFGISHNRDKIKSCEKAECEFGSLTIDKKFVFDTVKKFFGLDISKKDFSALDEFSLIPPEAYDGKLFHFPKEIFNNDTVYYADVQNVKKKGKNLFLTGELYEAKNKSVRPAKFEAAVKPVKNSWNIISINTIWDDRFPDLGLCISDKVRLRASPGTDAKIVGQVNKNNTFVLLDVKEINGEKWYLIDHPAKKGNAWIFGKFVKKYYDLKDCDHTEAHKITMQLRLDYGITPDKTRALHGKPLEILRDGYGNFEGLKYKNFTLYYGYDEENELSRIELGYDGKVTGNFGPIKIGDDKTKLLKVLGQGKNIWDEETFIMCDSPSGEVINFNLDENNKISSMSWLIEEH